MLRKAAEPLGLVTVVHLELRFSETTISPAYLRSCAFVGDEPSPHLFFEYLVNR